MIKLQEMGYIYIPPLWLFRGGDPIEIIYSIMKEVNALWQSLI